MTAEAALARVFAAAGDLAAATPALRDFAPWPEARPVAREPVAEPVAAIIAGSELPVAPETASLAAAVRAAAPHAWWRLTYDASEVGEEFLSRYGWFELIGPTGHFEASHMRAYIAYWGEGLHYPWHVHEAEEIYFVLSGEALFETEGEDAAILGPGFARYHSSWRPHALTTKDSPVLTFVLWRGGGLTANSQLGRGRA